MKNPKVSQQKVGPYCVKEKIGNLAYHLELLGHWKIHDVISIASLEPALKDPDPYNRTLNTKPSPLNMGEGTSNDWYEIKHMLNH